VDQGRHRVPGPITVWRSCVLSVGAIGDGSRSPVPVATNHPADPSPATAQPESGSLGSDAAQRPDLKESASLKVGE
jgi:hypothetical protein